MRWRLPTGLPTVLLVVAIIAAAAPAGAAGDQPKPLTSRPLTSRRLFEQSRPGVQLITVEFSAGWACPSPS